MPTSRATAFATPAMAVAAITMLVLSCGDGAVEPAPPPTPMATTVTVTPGSAALTALEETARFTAEVRDQNGQVMAGAAVAWTSSDASVAPVDASGQVTAAGNGSATITATSGSASGTAAVMVAQIVSAVVVSPAADTLVAFGDTVRLVAEATDANGHGVTDSEFSWSSSDTLVARVDDQGLVESIAEGDAVVTATVSEVTGAAELSVVPALPTAVAVSPDSVLLTALGQTVQLAAEVRDQAGRVMVGAVVSWSSGDTLVVVVDSAGLLIAVDVGITTVTAASGDVSTAVVVTVAQSAGDRVALVALYEATDGPNWIDNENWLTDAPLREWHGVDTDASGRVVRLRLRGRWDSETRVWIPHGLSGSIPPELGNLGSLRELDLRNNNLTGPIPPELGDLGNLRRLYLGSNDLTGPIPPELGGLASLENLDLGGNGFSGAIPPELGNLADLERLDLNSNKLSDRIPTELGKLANLTDLLLGGAPGGFGGNELTGPIPAELGNLSRLTRLWLGNNDLTGSIPKELGNLARLTQLSLGGNDLSGLIPPELGNLASLEVIALWRNNLTGPIPPELGQLASLTNLSLGGNSLDGSVPPELGNLANLTEMYLWGNNLSGPIPSSFLQLGQLRVLSLGSSTQLCTPGTAAFVEWLRSKKLDGGPANCNAADVAVLTSLHETTGGAAWADNAGWLEDQALENWYGVTADSIGRVTTLDLTRNGLTGQLPSRLGELSRMKELRIGDNPLTGRLPLSLARLPLREFHYGDTQLCAPVESDFQTWLDAITSHQGTGVECTPVSDRDVLETFYRATSGPDWIDSENWLTDAPLDEWYGVETDESGRVTGLQLAGRWDSGSRSWIRHGLAGGIPPELTNLGSLRELDLGTNDLTGPVPPELGRLASLQFLYLGYNDFSGSIPPELSNLGSLEVLNLVSSSLTGPIPPALGSLGSLWQLDLRSNDLAGPIPPELGDLASLAYLHLSGNGFSGSIPPALGSLENLRRLGLASNDLAGPVPPQVGRLSRLQELDLSNNQAMAGALPADLTALSRIETIHAGGTGLCAPRDSAFEAWLSGIRERWIARCVDVASADAYLTQAVQSREFPVPLVAGDRALLRVFTTAVGATGSGIPDVRARFYRDGWETHAVTIPGTSAPIPTRVTEGELAASANAEIPGHVIQPGVELVIDVDPNGTLDPGLGVARRIPETGRLAVDVETMPLLDLTVIPFVWSETQDSSIVDLVSAMAADPENHAMLEETRTLLPVGDLAVTAHPPVVSSSNSAFDLLAQTEAIRVIEGGNGHYQGMMEPPVTGAGGVAKRPGRSSFSQPYPDVIAHELGHNFNLRHAPCGRPSGVDPWYPYPDGTIGAWGFDFQEGGRLMPPSTPDLMSYCGPPDGSSDYHFIKALRFRLVDEGGGAATPATTRSLLVWGGVDAENAPFLEPAFVVDAPPLVPQSDGDYELTGWAADGGALFSLSFAMPVVADGAGEGSFVFALPVQPAWADNLASITLSGPEGSATLDGSTDRPMAILRNLRTGQVRGFLWDPAPPTQAAADAVGGAAGQGTEMLFSRGIPGAIAWRR